MATVELVSVSKYRDAHIILDHVDLKIERGEFVAVVGPSGSGKSTLLRAVAGLETISEGSILINDLCVNQIAPAKRNMAMVFQNYALYPHMTVYANMAYGLKMRGMKKDKIQARVLEVAELLQLTAYLYRKPTALSGGQRQRVAMGRAMVRSPAVFLFDEPLSNLDAKLRTEMRHEIKKLHRQFNTTCLYVTHDQVEAMTLADRVVILNHGRIEQVGTPYELYNHPKSIFVASFIGHYPMNFIEGKLNEQTKSIDTVLGISMPVPGNTGLADQSSIMIGVRPEHIQLNSVQSPATFQAKIEFIDDMGADKLLQINTVIGQQTLSIRIQNSTPQPEETLSLAIDWQKANLFCKHTGLSLGVCHG